MCLDVVVFGAQQLPSFPQGMGVVGRVLDPLGEPLDSQGPVTNAQTVPSVEQPVPSIISRARVQSMIESVCRRVCSALSAAAQC